MTIILYLNIYLLILFRRKFDDAKQALLLNGKFLNGVRTNVIFSSRLERENTLNRIIDEDEPPMQNTSITTMENNINNVSILHT